MQNQINPAAITQFIQLVKSAELNQSREIKMSIQQARLLVLTLTEIQDKLLQDYDALLLKLRNTNENQIVNVSMDGGGFKVN